MDPRKTPVLSPVSVSVTDSEIRPVLTESSFPFAGINIATITPASVACSPDFKMQTHNITAKSMYGDS